MAKKIVRLTETELIHLVSRLIKENEGMESKCTFTISQLFKKNKQGLIQIPETFEVSYVEGECSVKVGQKVNLSKSITMGKGEIIFDLIEGFGQATISCDGKNADINVSWD